MKLLLWESCIHKTIKYMATVWQTSLLKYPIYIYIYVSKNDYFRYDTNGICVYEKYGLIFLMISDDFHKMVGVIFHILFLKIGSMAVDDWIPISCPDVCFCPIPIHLGFYGWWLNHHVWLVFASSKEYDKKSLWSTLMDVWKRRFCISWNLRKSSIRFFRFPAHFFRMDRRCKWIASP